MYCNQCGKEISDDTKFCEFCGAPKNNASNVNEKNISDLSNSNTNYQGQKRNISVAGLIYLILGSLGAIFSIFTIIDDRSGFLGYTYKPPFTGHEVGILLILGFSLLFIFLGILCIIAEREKK